MRDMAVRLSEGAGSVGALPVCHRVELCRKLLLMRFEAARGLLRSDVPLLMLQVHTWWSALVPRRCWPPGCCGRGQPPPPPMQPPMQPPPVLPYRSAAPRSLSAAVAVAAAAAAAAALRGGSTGGWQHGRRRPAACAASPPRRQGHMSQMVKHLPESLRVIRPEQEVSCQTAPAQMAPASASPQ